MKAMLVNENRDLVWSDVPDPVRRENEVLIEVHSAAVNRADLRQREGKYPPPPGWPEWMGLEAAGVVLEAPAGSRWHAGDQVCALLGGGGYAEKVAVPEELVMSIPRGLSMTEAASLPEVFATAYLNLKFEADLKAGETFFMQAAASGLGIAAIQTAKAFGARVIASAGGPEKVDFLRSLGVDIAIDRKTEDIGAVLDANPPDVSLDCVGGPDLGKNLIKMARGGRWVVVSTLGGEFSEIPLRPFFTKGLSLKGSTLRSRTNEMKSKVLRGLEADIWPALESGRIRPVLHRVLPMEQADAAHAILKAGENIGKVVLTIR